MEEWHRRSVLATGAALSAGGLASIGVGASESGGDEAPDLPNMSVDPTPEMNEDWASYQGDAGHARFIDDGYEFDGAALEVAWSVDYTGSVAVADNTVYTANASSAVAFDAEDGSLVWENTDVDARDPVVVGESVYLSGGEITALDRSDGSVRWETDFNTEGQISRHMISSPTVAYDGVYAVVDGTLYALEADDGSIRWKRDAISDKESDGDEEDAHEFNRTPAAANGVVYAGTEGGTFALEPETGDEIWRTERQYSTPTINTIRATSTAVIDKFDWAEELLFDAYTGEIVGSIPTEGVDVTLGNEITVSGGNHTFQADSIDGSEYHWQKDILYEGGSPVISGETVYNFFGDSSDGQSSYPDYSDELVALNKYDGTERWSISTEDMPVGPIRAISGETIYVDRDGELVALRERADGEDAADEREDEGSDDSGDGDAGESDDANGDEDAPDDTGEDADDGDTDCPNAGSDSECEGDDSSDDSDDGDDLGDAGGDGSGDDEGTGDGDSNDGVTGDQTENGTTDAENDADDGVPGFTTGAGLLGGALGLEWLRRRADADEPTE